MKPIEIVAQVIGIVAMAFIILSYQQKKQKGIIFFQLCGGLLFSANYLMLGAIVGGLMNVIATVRGVVYLNKERFKSDRWPWLAFFVCSYVAVYVLSFTVFGKEPTPVNFLLEVLPVIGMTASNLGFMAKEGATVRRFCLVSSPCWLVYNVAAFSVGAIICEVLSLFSIVIGMYRHDRKKEEVK